jgi:anthranilate synthase component II
MIVLIDNYDSFTHNLFQYLSELTTEEIRVIRNDRVTVADLERMAPSRLIISPGPGRPEEAGVSVDAIRAFAERIPILGVCLGHQSIGQAFGGRIVRAGCVMHGKTSAVHHRGQGVFADLPDPFTVVRYHSLVIDKTAVPECLEVTAWTETPDGERDEIMGVRHRTLPVEGVQFHPESILTEHGHALLRNFLTLH